jgi:hypothetical protein
MRNPINSSSLALDEPRGKKVRGISERKWGNSSVHYDCSIKRNSFAIMTRDGDLLETYGGGLLGKGLSPSSYQACSARTKAPPDQIGGRFCGNR